VARLNSSVVCPTGVNLGAGHGELFVALNIREGISQQLGPSEWVRAGCEAKKQLFLQRMRSLAASCSAYSMVLKQVEVRGRCC
jgi:hypothetical protein